MQNLDKAQLATVLAALRTYQGLGYGEPGNRPEDIHYIATDADQQISLDDAGIDALCVQINCSPDDSTAIENNHVAPDEALHVATKPLPPDPEQMNEVRAGAAERALEQFSESFGEVGEGLEEQNLTDLLCDFGHLCDREEISLTSCLRKAQYQYAAETDDKGTQEFLFTPYQTLDNNGLTTPEREKFTALLVQRFPWLIKAEETVNENTTVDDLAEFFGDICANVKKA